MGGRKRQIGVGERRVGVRGGEEGSKSFQVKTRGHQLHSDGPDHSTRPRGHHFGRG